MKVLSHLCAHACVFEYLSMSVFFPSVEMSSVGTRESWFWNQLRNKTHDTEDGNQNFNSIKSSQVEDVASDL